MDREGIDVDEEDIKIEVQIAKIATDVKWIKANMKGLVDEHCERGKVFGELKRKVDRHEIYLGIIGTIATASFFSFLSWFWGLVQSVLNHQ